MGNRGFPFCFFFLFYCDCSITRYSAGSRSNSKHSGFCSFKGISRPRIPRHLFYRIEFDFIPIFCNQICFKRNLFVNLNCYSWRIYEDIAGFVFRDPERYGCSCLDCCACFGLLLENLFYRRIIFLIINRLFHRKFSLPDIVFRCREVISHYIGNSDHGFGNSYCSCCCCTDTAAFRACASDSCGIGDLPYCIKSCRAFKCPGLLYIKHGVAVCISSCVVDRTALVIAQGNTR